MSHIVFFLLLRFPPRQSFKLFNSLLLKHKTLYKFFTFDQVYIGKLQCLTQTLFHRYYPNLFNFFNSIGDAIITGPTGNNVRDLRILLAG